MPECAPVSTHTGQEGRREAGSGAKTGLEDAPRATIAGNVPRTGRESCLVQPFPRYRLADEQALLAKVRYNRLIGIFQGLTTCPIENHLSMTVVDLGQIEIDELCVGLDTNGCHYVIPAQAKGGRDQVSIVQTMQDISWCEQKYPTLRCRAISAQFITQDQIALFELQMEENGELEVTIVEERHCKLAQSDQLDQKRIISFRPWPDDHALTT